MSCIRLTLENQSTGVQLEACCWTAESSCSRSLDKDPDELRENYIYGIYWGSGGFMLCWFLDVVNTAQFALSYLFI